MNAERKAQQINTVSYETFEIIMDRLEKEYYELVRVASIFIDHKLIILAEQTCTSRRFRASLRRVVLRHL